MDLLAQPLATTEFIVVDTETNGRAGDACELTEVGAVLVGGGELHDRWETLVGGVAPLSRSIQRFTQISQAMVDEAPAADAILPDLADADRRAAGAGARRPQRRVRPPRPAPGLRALGPRVARSADAVHRRAGAPLRAARAPAPARRARRLARHRGRHDAPRARRRGDVRARVLRAVRPAVRERRDGRRRARGAGSGRRAARARRAPGAPSRAASIKRHVPDSLDFAALPDEPGVYIFRNAAGPGALRRQVGRAAHARAGALPRGRARRRPDWSAQAALVDHRTTSSELGALVLENRLIRELRPPGNVVHKHDDTFVYLRCRLDIAYPVLEVAREPAAGRSVTIGPLRSRAAAVELKEQLDSLFGLRHCGRKLRLRPWPSAYGQMGRCMSPCLNDLDPNLYRRKLDEALALFGGSGDGGAALLAHIDAQMRAAAAEQRYERAAWLRRRRERIAALVRALDGNLQATHTRPRLVLAPASARRRGAATRSGSPTGGWWTGARRGDLDEDRLRAHAARGRAPRRDDGLPAGHRGRRGAHRADVAGRPRGAGAGARPAARARRAAGVRQSLTANGSSTTSAVAPPATSTVSPGTASRRTSASAIGPNVGETSELVSVPTTRSPRCSSAPAATGSDSLQAAQMAVGLAAVEEPRHRLLADVAALREAHGAGVEPGLLGDRRVVDVDAVARPAALDAEDLGGVLGDGRGAGGERARRARPRWRRPRRARRCRRPWR